jgi:phosphoribosylaminoimidazole-succinocarboxamide synthase
MAEALLHARVDGREPDRRGKVRDLFETPRGLVIVSTDRISAFDVVLPNGIPGKGRILNQLSAFWFKLLEDACPHHLESILDQDCAEALGGWDASLAGRCALVRRAEPLPIECIVRGLITGSLLKEYRAEGGIVHGLQLPEGLLDGSRLPEPIFTPATKAEEGHDENISASRAIDLVGADVYSRAEAASLAIYMRAAAHAAERGLILADTKFEFGLAEDGLIWIDEALTPDSSRYWPAEGWEPGRAQPSFDKQFVRDWLEAQPWDKNPPGPALPPEIAAKSAEKYQEAFDRLTGPALP